MLDRAVGTTFTLDLMTLLAVPLAFTFSDVQDRDGQIPTEPLSLLESARRYADRIVVFCHGGQTGVPRARQPALAFIEQSVLAAFPPRRESTQGRLPSQGVGCYATRREDDTADESIKIPFGLPVQKSDLRRLVGHLARARWRAGSRKRIRELLLSTALLRNSSRACPRWQPSRSPTSRKRP